MACRDKAGRQARGGDEAEGDENRDAVAPAPAPAARVLVGPGYPGIWDVSCDGGNPLTRLPGF